MSYDKDNDILPNVYEPRRATEQKAKICYLMDETDDKDGEFAGSRYALSAILSEGELKAISLAEFLTELQLDETRAPIVFDDPVTSLDHNIIDEVARRLVELSQERQVIIFTHSILLFNSLKQKSDLAAFKHLEYKYWETQTDLKSTGILYESPTLREDTFNKYKAAISEILNLPKEERTHRENELAARGYDQLRAAIEVLVEVHAFNNTVKRYRRNVALSQFEAVNGALIDKHKDRLNQIFEKCCDYIDAHSKADGLNRQPRLSELKTDFDEICEIRKDFVN